MPILKGFPPSNQINPTTYIPVKATVKEEKKNKIRSAALERIEEFYKDRDWKLDL